MAVFHLLLEGQWVIDQQHALANILSDVSSSIESTSEWLDWQRRLR